MKKRVYSLLLALLLIVSAAVPAYAQDLTSAAQAPQFRDGLAQPLFDIDRDIERFCVYVETDYDTDADGKLDLIKTVVQLPTAAMNGDYKAGVIYEARPYIAGEGSHPGSGSRCSEADLYRTAAPRVPRGSATTAEVAASARPGEYDFYENIDWYDYFLVRGFAVVTAAGLGTRGSEGYETCGTDLEIDAFASVIEWLNGSPDAVAYTDRTGNIAVNADWSNGKIGMTGRSYSGTTQFGIAGTGVAGLETIVPVSGIASWYEYQNSQGYRTGRNESYNEWLASYCASRVHDSGWDQGRYGSYLNAMAADQADLNGDYGTHYERRDYTRNPNIHCSALIVHGLNDDNVRTKNFQMMYNAFRDAGANVKLLLHQDGHVTPAYGANKTEQFINGEAYQQVLNRWFSHYLFGVRNGAENMAAVTAQSNLDARKWNLYDSWEVSDTLTMTTSSLRVPDGAVIQGTVPVTVKAAPSSTRDNNLLHVRLVDTSSSSFNAFATSGSYDSGLHRSTGKTFPIGGGAQSYKVVELVGDQVRSKVIAEGWIDLSNPSADFASSTATPESVRKGQQYTYTVYLQANLYEVAPGHTLKLEVSADSGRISSYSAAIPVRSAAEPEPTVPETTEPEPTETVPETTEPEPTETVPETTEPEPTETEPAETEPAETEPASYTVRYSARKHGSVKGSVKSGRKVQSGTVVTLTATAKRGYQFSGWKVNGILVNADSVASFTITEDTNIVAQFKKQPPKHDEEEEDDEDDEDEEDKKPHKPGKPHKPHHRRFN